ncbi:alpha/beta hydrolase [Uliginosibacterium sp. H1]|uniref:alpha/beta hydrolase n=1 Tax=Uliginosibacterium sp. H1 TaxID=3114757 RepID=UPI002E196A83|nr:alpha/beta hydrolase [Uliginosibacterium sp. H1]
MPLDPRARSLLEMLNRIDAPRLQESPLDAARRNFHKLLFAYREEPQAVESVQDLAMPRRSHEGGPLLGRLYRPASHGDTPLPALLWMHGGGWTLGDVAGYDSLCRRIANDAGCIVLSLDYRLAPENAFPAALDDALFAWRWLQKQAGELGVDALRVAVGGDSAGGNLAAVLCHLLRDAGGQQPCLQWLVYPATDMLSERTSHALYGEGHFLDRASIAWFQHNYLPSESDWRDWRASPIYAPRFDGLPPALLMTAECDPLTDDGVAYLEKLTEAGVATTHLGYAGMIHGFLTMGRILPAAGEALDAAAAALRAVFRMETRQ